MEKKRMIGVEWVEFLKNHPTPELKQKLDEILLAISWGEFANNYMGEKARWIHEKIDGYSFEGEPVEPMGEDELLRFKNGLFDLSERIRRIAESLG